MQNFSFSSRTIRFFLAFIFAVGILYSCTKDQVFDGNLLSPVNDQITTDYPEDKLVVTNLFGTVVDENENPISGSEVLLNVIHGEERVTTDEDGNFLFTNVLLYQYNTFLKVNHAGKFEAFRKMSVTPDSYNFTKIKLLDKNMLGSIPATQGGAIHHENNAQVQFMPNSIRYENGEEYFGDVQVAMTWLDPTANDLADRMIGDLSGIDVDGKQVVLGTFGMLSVELFADNGEALQLKEEMPATLSFPVPAEILDQAPAEIPLWYYDENLGTWVEEGSAVLIDGFYVGTVSHFSSWNVDWKGERIRVIGEVFTRIDEDEFVVPYLQVYVDVNGVQQAGGFLDDNGEFEFFNFPANTEFVLRILGDCDEILLEAELGPFSTDTDLGTIVVHASNESVYKISGNGVDCEYGSIKDGYVRFRHNQGTTIYPVNGNGSFEFLANVCNKTEGEITLTDLINKKSSVPQTIDFSVASVHFDLLKACEELESFIEIIDEEGDVMYFEQATATRPSTWSKTMHISAVSRLGHSFEMDIPIIEGTGTFDNITASWVHSTWNFISYEMFKNNGSLEVTEFSDNSGDIIRGSFEGEVTIFHGDIGYHSTVKGSLKVIRE